METLGKHTRRVGRVEIRCQRPSRIGTAKVGRCEYFTALDLETLVATRGHAFPLTMLQSRLKCPRCGDKRVLVLFHGDNPRARTRVSS